MRPAIASIAVAAAACAAATAAPTTPGRYEAELCVATRPDVAPSCGAAEAEVASTSISVRVSDILYRMALHGAELEVETMHGGMQIDEFSAPYLWDGATLRFKDPDKDVRYEVRIGARKAGAP